MKTVIFLLAGLFSASVFAQDISNCYDNQTRDNSKILQSQGFTQTGSQKFEVVSYRYADHVYWKEVTANRFEKNGQVSYATCYGIVSSPLLINGQTQTLQGDFYSYGAYRDFSGLLQFGWTDPRPGMAFAQAKDFQLDRLGGGALLTLHVTAKKSSNSKSAMDEDLVLAQSGTGWSAVQKIISLQIENNQITASTITTRPPHYDPYDPTGTDLTGRDQFRSGTMTPALSKKVIIENLPAKTGIQLSTGPLITFAHNETPTMEFVNTSAGSVAVTATAASPGFFRLNPGEKMTMTAAVPGLIQLQPDSGAEIILELKYK